MNKQMNTAIDPVRRNNTLAVARAGNTHGVEADLVYTHGFPPHLATFLATHLCRLSPAEAERLLDQALSMPAPWSIARAA